ncbi:hypothetical protein PR003_g5641 [Phytophthora rubi]|uniref:Glutamine amidotransferase type-2 domain-containing protein n=1 Tax=Phytophthora rubi TaxID=129364 RepID=A0A6A3NF28_9STRA|nr:hypothetical protein PR002_g5760 [Phytophthora rubi]KAE9041784.1 hypothetical protein PR001_g6470 [Phytophthora rubi]KAE9349899.1 hypothetical protein PR003_g5641 [Phytophthora rubi]
MCGIGLVLAPACSSDPPSPPLGASSSASSPDSNDGPHSCNAFVQTEFDLELQRRLCQRGPDHFQRVIRRVAMEFEGDSRPHDWAIAMHSAVLHLRGDQLTPQPVSDSDANVLCWNGEVFGMDGDISEEEGEVLMQGSDTIFLSERLQIAGRRLQEMTTQDVETQGDPVVETLRRVQGPFAVAWLHESTNRVYFAHDRFGRRSLLYRRWGADEEDVVANLAGTEKSSVELLRTDLARFVLSSVAIGDSEDELSKFQELPAFGIYVLDLRARPSTTDGGLSSYRMEFHPYAPLTPKLPILAAIQEAANVVVDRFGNELPRPAAPVEISETELGVGEDANELESSASALVVALSNAVGVRVRSIPARPRLDNCAAPARVAVLFSGGLDSVVIAALTHFHVAADEPVDLLTVCFDESSAFTSPDRLAAELAHAELCALFPARQWNLVKVNVARAELSSHQREVLTLMAPCETHMDFNIGAAFWFLSRGLGELKKTAQAPENATMEELNAFLKPQRADLRELETEVAALQLFGATSECDNTLLCPVKRCGRKRKHGCIMGVCKSCCFKMQRAMETLKPDETGDDKSHVNSREAQGYRAKLLSMGVQSEDHLDLLLSLLKSKRREEQTGSSNSTHRPFLSCRVHRVKQEQATESEQLTPASATLNLTANTYQTTARVVLVGIGADEQLAGYGRHRTALINGGEDALRAELQVDLGRIWKRNLGRDDRCIASHGREARFPYLDESVVSTIATFPVSSLCDAELPRGVGDKRALRLVAKSLGLRSCAGLAKRAIQFGSRIAKVSNSGSNRQTQGMNKFSSVQ